MDAGLPNAHKEIIEVMISVASFVDKTFSFLIEEGFLKKGQKYDSDYFEVIYQSEDIVMRIETYRREIYMYFSKNTEPTKEVNMFNLIEFFEIGSGTYLKSNYYREITNETECYRLQVEWLAKCVKTYLHQIQRFFMKEDYLLNLDSLTRYLKEKYPNLFATW